METRYYDRLYDLMIELHTRRRWPKVPPRSRVIRQRDLDRCLFRSERDLLACLWRQGDGRQVDGSPDRSD